MKWCTGFGIPLLMFLTLLFCATFVKIMFDNICHRNTKIDIRVVRACPLRFTVKSLNGRFEKTSLMQSCVGEHTC